MPQDEDLPSQEDAASLKGPNPRERPAHAPSPANPYTPDPHLAQRTTDDPPPSFPHSSPPGTLPFNPYGPPPGPPPGPLPYDPYGPPPGALFDPAYPAEASGAFSPHAPPRPPFPGAGWFLLLTLIGFALNAAVSAIGAVVVSLVTRSGSPGPHNPLAALPPAALFGILLVASLSWPVVALVSARLARVFSRDTFRFRSPGLAPMALSLLLGAALVPLALALEHLASQLVPRGDNLLLQVLANRPGPGALVLLGLALVVSAPVGEELLFRGLGLRGMERRYGWWPAALLVSLIFASVHLNLTGFFALAGVSLVLCWLTHRTGSILPAMLTHASYNGLQFVMLLVGDHDHAAVQRALDSNELGIPLTALLGAALLSAGLIFAVGKLSPPPVSPPVSQNSSAS